MEPPPPPDQISPKPDPVRPWAGIVVWLVLFVGAQVWSAWDRAKQGDERRQEAEERRREAERHDRKLKEISAQLEELGTRARQAHQAPR